MVSVSYNLFLIKVLKYQYDKPHWTFGKWLLQTIILILLISIANFLYMTFLPGYSSFTWTDLLYQVYSTFLVGIFPLILFGTITMLNKERFYNNIASDINVGELTQDIDEQNLVILGQFELTIQELLYIESMQNYATVHLIDGRSAVSYTHLTLPTKRIV